MDADVAQLHGLTGRKKVDRPVFDETSGGRMRFLRHEHRYSVFPGKNINAADMIIMLVGDEDAPQFGQRKSKPAHPFHDLFCAHARVDQNGILVIFKIIAVAVTAGRDRSNFQNTFFL